MAQLSSTDIYGNLTVNNKTILNNELNLKNNLIIGTYATTNTGFLSLTGSTANKQAILKCTNGNLHIDADSNHSTYINYYTGTGGVHFGNGASGSNSNISAAGNLTAVGGTFSSAVSAVGLTTTNNLTISTGYLQHTSIDSYDKIRVYSASQYTIGMKSAQTYGGLNNWAMTFTMNNYSTQGFLWRAADDIASDGAMSLTTTGILTVKSNTTIGGSLTVNSHVYLGDSDTLHFGTDNNFGISNNGTNTYLSGYRHGAAFYIQGENAAGVNKVMFYGNPNGVAYIYHAGNIKIRTSSTGATISGDLQVDGSLIASGIVTVSNTTDSSAVTNGALIVSGGVGIAKKLYVGGVIKTTDTTASTNYTTGSLIALGGLGVAGAINSSGNIKTNGTLTALSRSLDIKGSSNADSQIYFASDASILWDESADRFDFNKTVRVNSSFYCTSYTYSSNAFVIPELTSEPSVEGSLCFRSGGNDNFYFKDHYDGNWVEPQWDGRTW